MEINQQDCLVKLNNTNPYRVETFYSDHFLGSPQFLYFCENETELEQKYLHLKVEDDFDHGLFYLSGQKAFAAWKNKKGPVEFCGSGAFALAWLVHELFGNYHLEILTKSVTLKARMGRGKVELSLPVHRPEKIIEHDSVEVFTYENSGIYFIRDADNANLKNKSWEDYVHLLEGKEIKGIGLFQWDNGLALGKVRYFTPWFGRDEDHVTGSIHQYLTPLVDHYFFQGRQLWTQMSARGGVVKSKLMGDQVILEGRCSIV